ncbi:F-box domain containing protein, expressed [Panicum miliaceum]|uniref:F-box domain containing protein, expressed n=1 Tax=Panicum miliaceum TaxID=4540 RepID=A0A3L6T5R5_PANMI|nr:F-box domain containing protein, expressed [Panicum miliaceum]
MPSLLKAAVTTEHYSWDSCDLGDCNCDDTGSNDCVLLKGLSEAKDLALISGPDTFIFKRDLRWCLLFSNLKTLLLNDYWCVPDDFRSLVCILEHSPVLEKLTLELVSKKHRQQRERKGILRPMEGSAVISEHLKIIEVRCHAVDERICKLTLFLCAFHILVVEEKRSKEGGVWVRFLTSERACRSDPVVEPLMAYGEHA